jgi:hypothetical protein
VFHSCAEQVNATDLDAGENGTIARYVINGAEESRLFSIDSRGLIVAREALDREDADVRRFHVLAIDSWSAAEDRNRSGRRQRRRCRRPVTDLHARGLPAQRAREPAQRVADRGRDGARRRLCRRTTTSGTRSRRTTAPRTASGWTR